MMVSGITLYHERPPAVAVRPVIQPPAIYAPFVAAVMQPVSAATASAWRQHPDPFDRTRQDSYDIHGRMVHQYESSGGRLDRLI